MVSKYSHAQEIESLAELSEGVLLRWVEFQGEHQGHESQCASRKVDDYDGQSQLRCQVGRVRKGCPSEGCELEGDECRYSQNVHRHVAFSVKSPPNVGPNALLRPHVAPI